jgi:hypothetical protein
MPNFVGEVGQRYKIYHKYPVGHPGGRDPNAYVYSGVYTESGSLTTHTGAQFLFHRFTDVTYPPGVAGPASKQLMDADIGLYKVVAKNVDGGSRRRSTRRRRASSTRRHHRASTRRH